MNQYATQTSKQLLSGLFVRGSNVMRGSLNPDADSEFKALGGWYDSGDIARVDKGLSNLCAPREIIFVKEIPKLGTGKVSHRKVARLIAGDDAQGLLAKRAAIASAPLGLSVVMLSSILMNSLWTC